MTVEMLNSTNDNNMLTWLRPAVGLLQASAVVAYIAVLTLFIHWLGNMSFGHSDVLGPIMFLTAFATSALITSSLALAYPLRLALGGQVKEAVVVVVWTAVFLIVILSLLMAITV